MKKRILTVCTVLCSMTAVMAQEQAQEKTTGFNRWSVDLNGGFSKGATYDPGYFAKEFSFNSGDLGVRYMLNSKFGIKADFGFNSFQADKKSIGDFDTKYYRTDIQGVANLGRVLNFESWTSRLNALAHMGAGYSWMTGNNFPYSDAMLNFIVGLTGQIRLTDRIALNGDVSMTNNLKQTATFNGTTNFTNDRVIKGTLYNASIGLSIYLGKQKQHADWYVEAADPKNTDKINKLEAMLKDSDADGVADYLDTEPNTPAGASIDSKGRANDLNNNGIADNVEKYIADTNKSNAATATTTTTVSNEDPALKLINGGYVCVFFDTKSSVPTKESNENINFILRYMQSHPESKCKLFGYADEIGKTEYNNKLSAKRANTAKDILIKAGVSADRLTITPEGEDNSVDPKSPEAKSLVRRVTFSVN